MWRELIQGVVPADVFQRYEFRPPATDSTIDELERSLQVGLPNELRSLLKETNGIADQYGRFVWSAEEIRKENLEFRSKPRQDLLYTGLQ